MPGPRFAVGLLVTFAASGAAAHPVRRGRGLQGGTSGLADVEHGEERRLLVTTAYWKIRSKQGSPADSDAVYKSCMADVMTLNTPMAIYGDAGSLEEMSLARGAAGPPLIAATEVAVQELAPCSEHRDTLWANETRYTNAGDVPSVALGCIWAGKPELLARSAASHPEYEWYAWMDVCMGHGAVPFRHGIAPWPSQKKIQGLPTDKVTVSLSQEHNCEECRDGWRYCHCLAGTAFVVPRALVTSLASGFSAKVGECLEAHEAHSEGAFVCLSDQVILTKMLLDEPGLFSVAASGYGAVATDYLSSGGANADGEQSYHGAPAALPAALTTFLASGGR